MVNKCALREQGRWFHSSQGLQTEFLDGVENRLFLLRIEGLEGVSGLKPGASGSAFLIN